MNKPQEERKTLADKVRRDMEKALADPKFDGNKEELKAMLEWMMSHAENA